MFLKGPGCTSGTIIAALGFSASNFSKLTSICRRLRPVSSSCFSSGALASVTQFRMKARKSDIADNPKVVLPSRSNESKKR